MSAVLDYALPTFRRFAERFGYDIILATAGWSIGRPIARAKVALLIDALDRYNFVLWLDADTSILND